MDLRFLLITFALVLLRVDALSQSCSTKYASTSTSKVPTSTVTVTRTVTGTKVVTITKTTTAAANGPDVVTITKTKVSHTTFWRTKADTTTTVPLTKGFTPMASATTESGVSPQRRRVRREAQVFGRAAVPRAASSSYPASVVCSAFAQSTATHTTYTTYQTTVQVTTTVTYTTTSATTSTVSMATRTVHAACQPSANNIIEMINSRNINYWGANGYVHGISGPDDENIRACSQSPQDCCETVWALGLDGFQYYGSVGYSGQCIVSESDGQGAILYFSVGPFTDFAGRIYAGNGPFGTPVFSGFYQQSNPSRFS